MSDYQGGGDETEWFKRASDLRFYYDPDLWVWHRRDSFSVRDLCSYAYRQGKAAPVLESIVGSSRRPRGPRCHEGSGPCGASSL